MEPSSTTSDVSESSVAQLNKPPMSMPNYKEALLICGVCRKLIQSKNAKLLPCLHSLCCQCDVSTTGGKITCSYCNQIWHANQTTNHFLLQFLTPDVESPKCDNCTENVCANFKCVECQDFLCGECSSAHRRVKLTKDHQIIQINVEIPAQDAKCSKHAWELLSWYCVTCEEVTCRNCQLENHAGHQYRTLQEHMEKFEREIKQILDENRRNVSSAEQVIKSAEERTQDITTRENAMKSDLHRAIEQIQEALNYRANFLLSKIEAFCNEKRKTCFEIKTGADKCLAMSSQVSCVGLTALNSSNKIALHDSLGIIRKAINNIEELKLQQTRASVNLQNIQLVIPVMEIISNMQQIGDVVVNTLPPVPYQFIPTVQHQQQMHVNDCRYRYPQAENRMAYCPQTYFGLPSNPNYRPVFMPPTFDQQSMWSQACARFIPPPPPETTNFPRSLAGGEPRMSPAAEKSWNLRRNSARSKNYAGNGTYQPRCEQKILPPPPLVHYGSQTIRPPSSTHSSTNGNSHNAVEKLSRNSLVGPRLRFVNRNFNFTTAFKEGNNLANDLASIARDIEPIPIVSPVSGYSSIYVDSGSEQNLTITNVCSVRHTSNSSNDYDISGCAPMIDPTCSMTNTSPLANSAHCRMAKKSIGRLFNDTSGPAKITKLDVDQM